MKRKHTHTKTLFNPNFNIMIGKQKNSTHCLCCRISEQLSVTIGNVPSQKRRKCFFFYLYYCLDFRLYARAILKAKSVLHSIAVLLGTNDWISASWSDYNPHHHICYEEYSIRESVKFWMSEQTRFLDMMDSSTSAASVNRVMV